MFGPLMFPESSPKRVDSDQEFGPCLFCSSQFRLPKEAQMCFSHIFEEHKLIIADSHQIANLAEYLRYWKDKLSPTNVKEYCSTMLVDVNRNGVQHKDEEFFLLSDIIAEDKALREKLKTEKIETVLEQQRFEREDSNYSRGCLFCRQEITSTRSDFLTHLSIQHNVQLGRPENLVHVDRFLDTIEEKINNLQCIFCEKSFKDRNVLKEHMRKKGHKRVNPNNQIYDQFYVVNYLEPGRKWKESDRCHGRQSSVDDDGDEPCDWSDWGEDSLVSIVCLFCDLSLVDWDRILIHMKTCHGFDYVEQVQGLDFYDQVKIVNYIRRQIFRKCCVNCDLLHESTDELLKHMTNENHLCLPPKSQWDQPQYYFPTYENDGFLCQIDDSLNENDTSDLEVALNEIDLLVRKEQLD